MGIALPLIPLLLISSSLANPIPLERAAPWPPEDIGILEQSAPDTMLLGVSDKLTCDGSGADRCLLFPIGCVPGVSCTDRLEMRRVQSGSNIGDIIVSLNLHVSRSDHMLVAVPMPDISNPNSTFLVGCSIDDAVAVVAKPDVDGVTEQLQLPWLRLVAVRATSEDLECIVSASPGHVNLPEGDVAVFAGDLEPEEEVRQSARIAGSLDEESTTEMEERREEKEEEGEDRREEKKEEEREEREERERVEISPPHSSERTTPSLEHSESHEPILISVEDQRLSTEIPHTTTVVNSSKANKLRLTNLHSSESSSAERPHRHSSAERTHSTHASVHHENTSTATTTQKTTISTSTTEVPQMKESTETTTETPSTEQPITTEKGEESGVSTTVSPPHHHSHHGDSHEQHKEKAHHSHERASVDKEHHSVRMEPVTTTTTEKTSSFEDDKELSEADKQLLREIDAGHVKEERRDGDEEEEETDRSPHADGTEHHRDATIYELSREAAQDPIGKRPSEHSHSHHSSSHGHSHEYRAADDEEEVEHTTKKEVHHDEEDEEEGGEGGRLHKDDERRQKMGEKKHQRRSEEEKEEEDEDEDDSSSVLSLIIPMVACLVPLIFG